jgi:DNA polymerase-3 subunit epsilon
MGKLLKGPWSREQSKNSDLQDLNDEFEFVAFDVETTGLYKNDKIIEIGMVAFKGSKIIEEWSTLINPMRDVGKTNIHGITPSMVSAAPIFEEVANDVFRFIHGRVLVGHNITFDLRMLIQELEKLEFEGDFGKGFCTLIASRRLLPGSGDTLGLTCEALSVPYDEAHSAIGDARTTMKIFEKLKEDSQQIKPASLKFQREKNPSRVIVRTAFKPEQNDALEKIRVFTSKIPFPTSDERNVAYLSLLNLAMQDLIISTSEEAELTSWAEELGISAIEREKLHKGYLDSFIQAALRDGVITVSEREMIEKVGKALNLPVEIPETSQPIKANKDSLGVGKKVCFTGEATGLSGEVISRGDLEALAAKVGLHPVDSVTKKGCDVLVAADETSMSGKAKKAKDWGIPVISVEKFISYCTFGK